MTEDSDVLITTPRTGKHGMRKSFTLTLILWCGKLTQTRQLILLDRQPQLLLNLLRRSTLEATCIIHHTGWELHETQAPDRYARLHCEHNIPLIRAGRRVVRYKHNEHSNARAPKKRNCRKTFAGGVRHGGREFDEAETTAAEAIE